MVCDHLLSALMPLIVADKPGFVKENPLLFTIRLRNPKRAVPNPGFGMALGFYCWGVSSLW
jgi:hypothetical protein